MKIVHGSKNVWHIKLPVLTIGNFDGVHLGHRRIFGHVTELARRTGGTPVVYTFSPHPVKTIAPSASPRLIQTHTQKMASIADCGIDVCIIEPFTKKFAGLTPEKFFGAVIIKRIAPVHIVVGHDLTFGRHRLGTVELLKKLSLKHGIKVDIVDAIFHRGVLISSTQIRNFISAGDIERANKLLGRPYSMVGRVVKGAGIGNKIGFHTANIVPENEQTPPPGVYATRTLGHVSATNIGFNPTFSGEALSFETHILNFSKNIRGKKIEVEFFRRLRDEIKFPSPSALAGQIKKDIYETKKFFKV